MSSERSAIAAFFRSIDGGNLVALPPSSDRFDQGEGHDEAMEVAGRRGIAAPDWIFWHRQSAWVFDSRGDLTAGLAIHWGGDHDRVAAALGRIPAPFVVKDGGDDRAFVIESTALAERKTEPFPDVHDTAAVKDRIRQITAPVERRVASAWTAEEIAWMEDVLRRGDLAAQAAVVRWIVTVPRMEDTAFEALMADWVKIYAKAPGDVLVWEFLRALERRDDQRLGQVIDVCVKRRGFAFSYGVAEFLAERGEESDLPLLYRLALTPGRYEHTPGNGSALRGWVKARAHHENRPATEVAREALQDEAFDRAARNELERIAAHG